MADTIKLPPLPEPVYTIDEDGNKVFYHKARLVHARDIAVARAVLEAAAKLKWDAMEVFNWDPSMTPQETRDVIEWYYGSILSMKIEGEA